MNEMIEHIRYLFNVNQVLKNSYTNYMISQSGLVFCVRELYKSEDVGLSYATLPATSYQHLYGLGVESDEVMMVLPIQLYRATNKKAKIESVYIDVQGTAKVLRVVTSEAVSVKGMMPETFKYTKDKHLDIMVGIITHRDKANKRMIDKIMDDISKVTISNTLYDSHGFKVCTAEEMELLTGKIKDGLGVVKITQDGLTSKITARQIPVSSKSIMYYRFTRSVSAPGTFIAHYILVREHISNHFIYQVMDLDASVL